MTVRILFRARNEGLALLREKKSKRSTVREELE